MCMSSQDDIHMANSSSPASFDFNLPKGAHTVRLFAIKGDFMPRNRRPKKNQTARPRSAWGTVIPRFDENGGIIAWQVRYPNPLAPGKRVQRQFKPWQELDARTWLEEEKHLVDLHNKGIAEWKHPTQRKKDKLQEFREQEQRHILFRDYVAQWESNYKLPNGGEIAGGTRRNLKLDIRHFITDFESLRLSEITPLKIKAWYDKPHPEGQWAFRRSCMRFKAILESATKPGLDGTAPLLQFNPFIFPIPPAPRSSRIDVSPVTPRELTLLAQAMPEYTRLSVFLSTLVGGLRCGELCGLRVKDIDLDGQTLHVRHSVNRGSMDRGEIRYSRTKTESSIRNVHIPDALMSMIRQHLHDYCDMRLPDSPVFVPRRARIMSQTTLEEQFAKARVKAGRPDLTFQGLRASHATLLMLRGGTLREVMNELGHTSEKVAIRYYQLTVVEHQSQIVDHLAQEFMDE
ncbi:phage integrase family protein [Bifidobacterium sp. DSM 109959]|uniref:Phage integrase family protein n=2 Tax=Bifidobacterium olomucense TaxID=2675324 RepID=A0A7Y0HVH4_9BIFI|nr:phage integrase family protein [Bifidobacterium sp. DSM 109959]